MACLGSVRLCARVEKLCQIGQNAQVRRKASSVRLKQFVDQPLTRSALKSCQELRRHTSHDELYTIAQYYFDGQGKCLRPMLCLLFSHALNFHIHKKDMPLLESQRRVAMISEMVHSASLIHDDVIDCSDFRRGKPSVNVLWNHKKTAVAGSRLLSSVRSQQPGSLPEYRVDPYQLVDDDLKN
ncbi:hypothetical protein FOCC_FOCC015525, partial [Frankliniella occidentalis]